MELRTSDYYKGLMLLLVGIGIIERMNANRIIRALAPVSGEAEAWYWGWVDGGLLILTLGLLYYSVRLFQKEEIRQVQGQRDER